MQILPSDTILRILAMYIMHSPYAIRNLRMVNRYYCKIVGKPASTYITYPKHYWLYRLHPECLEQRSIVAELQSMLLSTKPQYLPLNELKVCGSRTK